MGATLLRIVSACFLLVILAACGGGGSSGGSSGGGTGAPPSPPVAVATSNVSGGQAPLTVNFDASKSSDPQGLALSYAWTFGDGTTGTGATPAHVFQSHGSYIATVAVSDASNTAMSSPINVTVSPAPPVVPATSISMNIAGTSPSVGAATIAATDRESLPLTYSIATPPTVGTASINPSSGAVTFTVPGHSTAATDSFTVKAANLGASATGIVSVTLNGDPLLPYQWHLQNTGQNAFASTLPIAGNDINVTGAWTAGFSGKGIKVGVVDSGLEAAHEDLASNVDLTHSLNFVTGKSDPSPSGVGFDHGTSVAGIIGAVAFNGKGGRGVAYNATLRGYNLIAAGAGSIANMAAALGGVAASSDNDLFNASFGSVANALPTFSGALQSITVATMNMRGGLGAAIVNAAGNDFTDIEGASSPLCALSRQYGVGCGDPATDERRGGTVPLIVGALNAKGVHASYSNTGSSLWISAPGGEYGINSTYAGSGYTNFDPAIITTGRDGCNNANYPAVVNALDALGANPLAPNCQYTATMNGTSSATPIVAGVVAMMLEANPRLSVRDIKYILARTARRVDPSFAGVTSSTIISGSSIALEQGWVTNAGGYAFSNRYGFGGVDAAAAVTMAKAYTSFLAAEADSKGDYRFVASAPATIAKGGTGSFLTWSVSEAFQTVESVVVFLNIAQTPALPCNQVELTSPAGTKSILLHAASGFTNAAVVNSRIESNAFYGEAVNGTWTLRFFDFCTGSGVSTILSTSAAQTLILTGHSPAAAPTYTVGGTVTGLSGTGLVLQLNGGANLAVSANASFTFGTAINAGSTYAVTVLSQPSNPSQTCTVASGTGTATADVTNVAVTCTNNAPTTFTIGGSVTGLATGASLVLLNNGSNATAVASNTTFTFSTAVNSGAAYVVTVQTQPAGQSCTVANGSGTASANVTNVAVTCSANPPTTFNVGGTISGLTGTGLVLRDSVSNQNKTIIAAGAYTFATKIASGASYNVGVTTQPSSPAQTCTVANPSGIVAGADVSNINVTCVANTYTVGGTVSGLVTGGSVVLQNNAGDNKTVSANGAFTFTTPLSVGATYAVTKLTDPTAPAGSPAGQTCTVTGGSGTIATANITSVVVSCVNNDTTAPTVSARTPLPFTVGTSLSTTITATFSEALDPATVTASTFTVTGSGGAVAGTRTLTTGNTKVVFTPTSTLAFDAVYTVNMTTGVKDVAGNSIAATSWSISTGKRLVTGGSHACARFTDGRVKCWGYNAFGQLGIDNNVNHGDGTGLMGNGTGASGSGLLAVALGRPAVSVAAGDDHSCAILDNGTVKCWGRNAHGELGMGFVSAAVGNSPNDLENNVTPVNLGAGRTAIQLALGDEMTCALLDDLTVKCWGRNDFGQLGQSSTTERGVAPNDVANAPAINLGTGRTAKEIGVGGPHVCAILDNNSLKCWGSNQWGQLGIGASQGDNRGDAPNEMGDNLPAVNLGTGVVAAHLAVTGEHACVLTTGGGVKCFGNNFFGQAGSNLGNGNPAGHDDCTTALNCIGDAGSEMGDNLAYAQAPGSTVELTVGYWQSCALLTAGQIKCWGHNSAGEAGRGNSAFPLDFIGDQAGEIAALTAAPMKPGKTIAELAGGGYYECVTNTDGTAECWGENTAGQLGRGDTLNWGDNANEMGSFLVDLDLGT